MNEKLERLKTVGARAVARVGVTAALIGTSIAARADGGGGGGPTPIDLGPITSTISFTSIGVGIVAIASSLAVVYIGIKGAKMLLGFLRG